MSNTLPDAYSHLPDVLAKHRLKVSDLRKKLKAVGVKVNDKSLYRLTSPNPLRKIDTRILGAICQTCHVGIEDVIVFEKPRPVLQKLSEAEQKRLDELMTKHSESKLNAGEIHEFDELSEKAHQLTIANARTLLQQRRVLKSAAIPHNTRASHKIRKRTQKRKLALQSR